MGDSGSLISYREALKSHYERHFGRVCGQRFLSEGPIHELPEGFSVLEFHDEPNGCWVYATYAISDSSKPGTFELFLLSPVQSEIHVETLTVVAHYLATGAKLDYGHTVNLGRPWLGESACGHAMICSPYSYQKSLGTMAYGNGWSDVFWLLPITAAEREFKQARGMDALEQLFEQLQFNYLDPDRDSVV